MRYLSNSLANGLMEKASATFIEIYTKQYILYIHINTRQKAIIITDHASQFEI